MAIRIVGSGALSGKILLVDSALNQEMHLIQKVVWKQLIDLKSCDLITYLFI